MNVFEKYVHVKGKLSCSGGILVARRCVAQTVVPFTVAARCLRKDRKGSETAKVLDFTTVSWIRN